MYLQLRRYIQSYAVSHISCLSPDGDVSDLRMVTLDGQRCLEPECSFFFLPSDGEAGKLFAP